jgi:hypothetical protein
MARSSRFRTAAQVFQAFPHLREQVAVAPKEAAPADFVKLLVGRPGSVEAIAFCAHLLPRLEAVAWGSRCLEDFGGPFGEDGQRLMEAVERWLHDPSEDNRRAALNRGLIGDRTRPETWLALAAGWSGASLVDGADPPVPPPPHLSAQLVSGAIVLALSRLSPYDRPTKVAASARAAVAYADGEELRLG